MGWKHFHLWNRLWWKLKAGYIGCEAHSWKLKASYTGCEGDLWKVASCIWMDCAVKLMGPQTDHIKRQPDLLRFMGCILKVTAFEDFWKKKVFTRKGSDHGDIGEELSEYVKYKLFLLICGMQTFSVNMWNTNFLVDMWNTDFFSCEYMKYKFFFRTE